MRYWNDIIQVIINLGELFDQIEKMGI